MIEMKHVSKWYSAFRVLNDCSLTIEKGEVVVICGPSGSGKSTLIKCMNGWKRFQQGEVIVGDISVGAKSTNLPKLRSRIGMVFQNFELFPHMTVLKNIALPQIKILNRSRAEAEARAEKTARPHGPEGAGAEISRAAIRRPAAARGDRARAGDGPGGDAVRRADLGARSGDDQ